MVCCESYIVYVMRANFRRVRILYVAVAVLFVFVISQQGYKRMILKPVAPQPPIKDKKWCSAAFSLEREMPGLVAENPDAPPTDSVIHPQITASLQVDHLIPSGCKGVTKWIIITTTRQEPAMTVKMLLNAATDWCLLIVGQGDRYVHSWTSDHLVYLQPQHLQSLELKLARKTPLNSLGMRNIGYLFAIAHGANVVLDLDDRSVPIHVHGQYFPVYDSRQSYDQAVLVDDNLNVLKTHFNVTNPDAARGMVWNPFPRFGLADAWPRGFPRDREGPREVPTGSKSLKCYPIVQHYLSVSNPDVDADYRRQHPECLQFYSKPNKPVVLPQGLFAPYNAQSTLHLYESLWLLLLPTTVNDRVSDIWRSYIAQSLFYLIPDACLMYTGPAIYRQRNDDGSDMNLIKEQPHYESSTRLLHTLKYMPMQVSTLEEAFLKVYTKMHEAGLLGKEDLEYVSAWISDLKTIGYNFPRLPDKSKLWTKDIQLCVMFNHAAGEGTVRLLLAYYLRLFDRIMLLFNGENAEKPHFVPDFVQFSWCDGGVGGLQHNKCLETCLRYEEDGVTGHLYIHDDMYINFTHLSSLPQTELWFVAIPTVKRTKLPDVHWARWYLPIGYEHYEIILDKLPQKWKTKLTESIGFPTRVPDHKNSDILYVPNSELRRQMIDVLSFITNTTDLHSEIAVPLAVTVVAQNQHVKIGMDGLIATNKRWDINRYNRAIRRNAPYIHPLKHSLRLMNELWCGLMADQLREHIKLST